MLAEGPFDPRNHELAVAAAKSAAAGWGVRVPAVGLWTKAASQLVSSSTARWRLEYDPRMRLVSFEVWVDGRCVYGSDDLVG